MKNKYSSILVEAYEKGIALSNKYSPYMLWKLAKHKDELVRMDLAKALVNDRGSTVALDILCKLSKDKDVLVRTEAVDSLSEYCSEKSYKALKNAVSDLDYLVRAYALLGVAYVGREICLEETVKVLHSYEEKEANSHCKLSIYEGLYILGEEAYLEKVINLFGDNDYQIQCSVANALAEIVDGKNIEAIRKFLDGIKLEDYPRSVVSSVKNLEKECMGYEVHRE